MSNVSPCRIDYQVNSKSIEQIWQINLWFDVTIFWPFRSVCLHGSLSSAFANRLLWLLSHLQDMLKNMRKMDDNIIYSLNTTIPTASFIGDKTKPANLCKELWSQVIWANFLNHFWNVLTRNTLHLDSCFLRRAGEGDFQVRRIFEPASQGDQNSSWF